MIVRYFGFALTHVLHLTELILGYSFHILYSLLHYDSFRESPFCSFMVQGNGCSIELFLFSIPKPVGLLVERPLIVSFSLLTWSIVAMSFLVHLSNVCLLFLRPIFVIQQLLGALTTYCRHSKCKVFSSLHIFLIVSTSDGLRPCILSLENLAEWFLELRSILGLLDVVESFSKTAQCLGLDHCGDMVATISLLAIGMTLIDLGLVIEHSWMDLFESWLVLKGLSVLL